MKANYEDKIPKAQSTMDFGNLYDVNKQLMDKEPAIDAETLWQKGQALEAWLTEHFTQKYFMLLCHERRDYTVFNVDKTNLITKPDLLRCRCMREDIIECMTNRGTLLALDLQEAGGWELWIRTEENEIYAYYLFPYGAAVLEY
jgi:hypothetical protein